MRLYLDTEFNGFSGALISLALHDPKGEDWYEVVEVPAAPVHFVRDHVLPVLGKAAVGEEAFLQSLHAYLLPRTGCQIVADWPEDFAHFMRCLCAEGGQQLKFECRMELVLSPPYEPVTRHNALSDAKALAAVA